MLKVFFDTAIFINSTIKMTHYTIAGHSIEVSGNGLERIPAFLPFVTEKNTGEEPILLLQMCVPLIDRNIAPFCSFPFYGKDTNLSLAVEGNTYIMKIERLGIPPLLMEILNLNGQILAKTNMDEHTPGDILCYGSLWAFDIVFILHQTLLVHASVIVYKGKAVLFLGPSGMGKSTHSQLWLNHILHTELLNDDTPAIRVMDDQTVSVFGAPWSGKTPCYKNKSAPIAGIVRLSQASHNKITQLEKKEALGVLLHACPTSFRSDETLLDHISDIFSAVLKQIPVYRMECLPNAEAARLVFKKVFKD